MKNYFIFAVLGFSFATFAQSKQPAKKSKKTSSKVEPQKTKTPPSSSSVAKKSDPIDSSKGVEIKIPEHLQKKGSKLRIRNLSTGKEVILTVGDEDFISSDVVRNLTESSTMSLVPEFSVLTSVKKEGRINAPSDPSLSRNFNKGKFAYVQPIWRPVPFALQKISSGATKIYIDTKQSAVPLSADEAAKRRALQESAGLKKLFDVGFKALSSYRFAISLEAFKRILDKSDYLSETQLRQAHLGHGISSFHQKGCQHIDADFKIADQDPKNFDDVSYYRALCFVEARRFDDAGGLFRDLTKRLSPTYAEQSRFYLGVVAENQERFDEAETAYMDTIDFANDQRVVGLAKQRLEIVKRLKAERSYESKWFAMSLSSAVGYDTNVVALPQGLSPSDYNLSNVKSLNYMGLASFDIKPKLSARVENHLRYTFLAMHYQDSAISSTSDLQTHNAAFSADFAIGAKDNMGFTVDYTSVFLGPIKTSNEYLANIGGELRWSFLKGETKAPSGDMTWNFKFTGTQPRVESLTAESNSEAQSYLLGWRYNSRKNLPSVLGIGVDLEYRPSLGVDNSYFSPALLGTWAHPLAGESAGLYLSHEAQIQDSYYFERSSGTRNDYVFKYTGNLSKVWWEKVETKLQFIGTMSFSNVSTYRYNKAQINFLVSASF